MDALSRERAHSNASNFGEERSSAKRERHIKSSLADNKHLDSSEKLTWTPELDRMLLKQVEAKFESVFPVHIFPETEKCKWSNLPMRKKYGITPQQLRNRYIEVLNPNLNRDPLKDSEWKIIDKFLSPDARKSKTCWADLSKLLYLHQLEENEGKDCKDLRYRGCNDLKNQVNSRDRQKIRAHASDLAPTLAAVPAPAPTPVPAPAAAAPMPIPAPAFLRVPSPADDFLLDWSNDNFGNSLLSPSDFTDLTALII